jgi:hypothetical protein
VCGKRGRYVWADAKFMAAAREAVPALIEEVEYLRRVRENTSKITHWIATGEPMEALRCSACDEIVSKYTREGVCLPCARAAV